jgi:hypothetical protein
VSGVVQLSENSDSALKISYSPFSRCSDHSNYAEPIAGRLPERTSPLGIVRCSAQSAKLNGLDPYTYMREVLERLPIQPASRITELLPHHCKRLMDHALVPSGAW